MVGKGLTLLATCVLLNTEVTAIPLEDFYPFGSNVGDNFLGLVDTATPNITFGDLYVRFMVQES